MTEELASSRCAICTELLTQETDSDEHVLPAAVGGRLKVKGFICEDCNSEAGYTWDASLVSQLHPLSLLHGVERQRGSTPALPIVTTAGEKLVIRPEGGFSLQKPTIVEVHTEDGGFQLQISARNEREARQLLQGVKEKYPHIDIEPLLANMQFTRAYPKGLVEHELRFGGEVAGRSIVKSALAMAFYAGMPAAACQDALIYLRNPDGDACLGYCQSIDLVIGRPIDVPLHCVAVEANPTTGLILGYVEYFGIHRAVLCLGKQYAGDPVRGCYAIDPRNGEKLDLSVNLALTAADVDSIFDYKMISPAAVYQAFANVVTPALMKQRAAELDRVTKDAAEYAFANCGAKPGETLTPDQARKLSALMQERIAPFLRHLLAPRPLPKTRDPHSDEEAPPADSDNDKPKD